MAHWYTNRDALKDAISIPAASTGDHDQLDAAIKNVSKLMDDYVGFPISPYVATRYQSPLDADCLYLDAPLLTVTSLRTDTDGDGVYETTWSTGDYWLAPYNAPAGSPARPYWEIQVRPTASNTFPCARRSVEIVGTWGYINQLRDTTATVASSTSTSPPVNATQGTIKLNGASVVHPGQTIRIGGGAEQLFVSENNAGTSTIAVDRAQNGTSGSSYTSGQVVAVYEYPIFEQAALYQAGQDFRARDMPMGISQAGPFGNQIMRTAGGLHPFVRRMLDPFHMPVTA